MAATFEYDVMALALVEKANKESGEVRYWLQYADGALEETAELGLDVAEKARALLKNGPVNVILSGLLTWRVDARGGVSKAGRNYAVASKSVRLHIRAISIRK